MGFLDSEGEHRLEVLETKFAYQEETISKLSDLTWELTRRLDKLESLFAALLQKMSELESPASNSSANQRPPHY